MFEHSVVWGNRKRVLAALLVFAFSHTAGGADLKRIDILMQAGKYGEAIGLLIKETEQNPAHGAARVLLAEAYEKAGMFDKAISTWDDLALLLQSEDNLRKGRRAVSRMRRIRLDSMDASRLRDEDRPADPFKIDMPEIDWRGLDVIEDSKYLPPLFPPPYDVEVPPFAYETEHFTVYSTNERLSEVVGGRAETYLDFMVERLFGGRAWAVRFPIVVYPTQRDYFSHGGPQGSAGVTMSHVSGKTQLISLFHLKPERQGAGRSGHSGSGSKIYKYAIESILPHELTHAVLNEFFAGKRPPQWLHEAVAGRFEQTRDHYGEAARLARKVVAGEYFRMRDLFDQKGYPERVGLFYEQAAVVVLYLFETGPAAMHAFLDELAAGNDHDAACSAALGIPEENAVEEFERRWVDWMRRRYLTDLDLESDGTQTVAAGRSNNAVFLPWVNEKATADELDTWRDVDLTSMESFIGVGRSIRDWSSSDNALHCTVSGKIGISLLGIRMNETPPAAVRCTVRYMGNPADPGRWFGFTQLDADANDTCIEALAPLPDTTTHEILCLWSDDLSVYLDGKCIGRYPATQVSGDARDIDFPLAMVAHGPVEIKNLRIASIDVFSDKPVVAQGEGQDDRRRDRSGRSRRRP